jgi:hypothetical protein
MRVGPAAWLRRRVFRPIASLAMAMAMAMALWPAAVFSVEIIKPTLVLQDVRVVVRYVSIGDMVELQRRFGANVDLRDIRQDYRHGFSILKTNRETGARTCEIYLPNDGRPRQVDDEGTMTLGHELLHCMLGNYHR